jgi:uncharacterized protein (UPF0335 family)
MSKEIEEKISYLQEMIADTDNNTEEEIGLYKEKVEVLKAKLPAKKEEKKKDAPAKKEPAKKAPAKKKEAKKEDTTKSKPKKGVKMISSKKVSVDGKEMDMNSQEFCDYLLSSFKERRAKAEENKGKKKKTTSVMSKVSANIEKGVVQAVKAGIKQKSAEIKKDPKQFIKKVEKLEGSTKSFLDDLKDVMGAEFDSKEVTATVKEISKMVDELKKKMKD